MPALFHSIVTFLANVPQSILIVIFDDRFYSWMVKLSTYERQRSRTQRQRSLFQKTITYQALNSCLIYLALYFTYRVNPLSSSGLAVNILKLLLIKGASLVVLDPLKSMVSKCISQKCFCWFKCKKNYCCTCCTSSSD